MYNDVGPNVKYADTDTDVGLQAEFQLPMLTFHPLSTTVVWSVLLATWIVVIGNEMCAWTSIFANLCSQIKQI